MKLPSLLLIFLAMGTLAPRADDAALPGGGFTASHYETLWTQSPFAVATSEAAPESSDYTLVGIAQFDGVSYASLIDKQNNNEHFLLASNKPMRGLTLVSVTHSKDASETTAVLQKNGESLTLKAEAEAPASSPTLNGPGAPPMIVPQIPRPGSDLAAPGYVPGQGPPPVIFRHLTLHLPPPPGGQTRIFVPPAPAPAAAPAQH